jgi:RNA polymerase primary sigma factor
LALEDKYEDIKKLIDAGKEKGYLTYDQVNDLIPGDVHSPDDLDDLLTTIGTQGIDVLDAKGLPSEQKFEDLEEGEDVELDLTPGALEKTNDPVRMYLREMGTVPLLTREGEVEIAKRIERGQLRVLKALSRSPIVIREILALGEDLKKGVRSIKELVAFDEEEITDEIVQARLQDFVGKIDDIGKPEPHRRSRGMVGYRSKSEKSHDGPGRLPALHLIFGQISYPGGVRILRRRPKSGTGGRTRQSSPVVTIR